jgi:AcrR family transcriptional regulator
VPSSDPLDAARPATRRRKRRKPRAAAGGRDVRVQILKSAAVAFRKMGYHGATVEHIAASLRMKKGNLYYYFRDKEDILFACHQYSLDRLLAILEDLEQRGGPADERLRQLIVAFVHIILDELHSTALFLDLEALSPPHRKAVIARRDRFDHGMRQVIQSGIRAGAFARSDAKLLSFAILGAINWIPRWFNPAGPSSSEEIADLFADFLITGLRSLNREA